VIQTLRDNKMAKFSYPQKIFIGTTGGIGTPEAAAAAFLLGAILLSLVQSINQCTPEAGSKSTVTLNEFYRQL